jgi:RNA polymerase sigma-B factor
VTSVSISRVDYRPPMQRSCPEPDVPTLHPTRPDEHRPIEHRPDEQGRARAPRDEYQHLRGALHRFAGLEVDNPRRGALREKLVTGYLPLARHLALRYRHRGVAVEDLEQVAAIGLIHAVDRFDPERGHDFLAFAVPTMAGEVRRYFRDRTWSMRVSRRLKDLTTSINKATPRLHQDLGRAPRPSELARHLDVGIEDVHEALQAAESYRCDSLDERLGDDSADTALADKIGEWDTDMELVEYREALQPLVARLPARERTILAMRFSGDMTQSQIAVRMGISQMHVSRLLTQTLAQLRRGLSE